METFRKPNNFGKKLLHIHVRSVSLLECRPARQCLTELTLCPESPRELYRPSDHRLSAKLVQTCADRDCHVVSMTDPYGRILCFLGRSRYFSIQVAPQLYSQG
jgi:hypothetical protein